jgi:hypothetical protein
MFAPGTANFRVGAIDKSIEARTDQEHGPGDFQTAVVMRFKCSRGPHRVGGYSKSDDEIGKIVQLWKLVQPFHNFQRASDLQAASPNSDDGDLR